MPPVVVNLFGGPGLGKSTTALGLTYYLKLAGKTAEYIHEEAKWVIYNGNENLLPYIQEEIAHKQSMMISNVYDYYKNTNAILVTDAPIALAVLYIYKRHHRSPKDPPNKYEIHLINKMNTMQNINIRLIRNSKEHPYIQKGRIENEEAAEAMDEFIIEGCQTLGINIDLEVKVKKNGKHINKILTYLEEKQWL